MLPTGLDTDGLILPTNSIFDESAQIEGFSLFLDVLLQLIQIYPLRDSEQKDLADWDFLCLDCLQFKNAGPSETLLVTTNYRYLLVEGIGTL